MPRTALLEPPYTARADALFARMTPGGAPPIGQLTLTARERGIVIDRTCALCGWYHAVSFAARAARLPHEPGAPDFADVPPRDR